MPRDPQGNYTLPAAYNPVITNTAITVDWANNTLDDIAAALTDSLDRGNPILTDPLQLPDGSEADPALVFAAETTLGIYRPSAGQIRMAAGGADLFRLRGVAGAGVDDDGVLEARVNDTWEQLLNQAGDYTIDGTWTFEATTTFNDDITMEDGEFTNNSPSVTEERVLISGNTVRIAGDPAGSQAGQAFLIFDRWDSGASEQRRRYEIKQASSENFAILAFEDDGSTVRSPILRYDRTDDLVEFSVSTQFGEAADSTVLQVYSDLLATGDAKTWWSESGGGATSVPPCSAYFREGVDSEDHIRIFHDSSKDGRGSTGLYFGTRVQADFPPLSTGDFVGYWINSIDNSGNLTWASHNATLNQRRDRIMALLYDPDREDQRLRIFGRTTVNGPRATEAGAQLKPGEQLDIEDADDVYKWVAYRRPTFDERTSGAAQDIELIDENQVIVNKVNSSTYTLDNDTKTEGFWCQVINDTSTAITLDAGSGDTLNLMNGGGSVTSAQTLQLNGGGAATIYFASGTEYYVFGAGLAP